MAVFIVAIASAMAMIVLNGSARSALQSKQGDQGLSIASAALETAAVFDCGTTTAMLASGAGDLTNPASPVPGALTTRVQRCVPADRAAIGDLGDAHWRQAEGNLRFEVEVRTNWVLFSPRGDVSNADPSTSGASVRTDLYRLRRDVSVTWKVGTRTRQRTLEQLAAPPPDAIAGSNRGSVTITGVPAVAGEPGTVTLSLGRGFTITHSAGADGVVRFPFLELEVAYPLSVNGLPRTGVTLTEGIPHVVQAA